MAHRPEHIELRAHAQSIEKLAASPAITIC